MNISPINIYSNYNTPSFGVSLKTKTLPNKIVTAKNAAKLVTVPATICLALATGKANKEDNSKDKPVKIGNDELYIDSDGYLTREPENMRSQDGYYILDNQGKSTILKLPNGFLVPPKASKVLKPMNAEIFIQKELKDLQSQLRFLNRQIPDVQNEIVNITTKTNSMIDELDKKSARLDTYYRKLKGAKPREFTQNDLEKNLDKFVPKSINETYSRINGCGFQLWDSAVCRIMLRDKYNGLTCMQPFIKSEKGAHFAKTTNDDQNYYTYADEDSKNIMKNCKRAKTVEDLGIFRTSYSVPKFKTIYSEKPFEEFDNYTNLKHEIELKVMVLEEKLKELEKVVTKCKKDLELPMERYNNAYDTALKAENDIVEKYLSDNKETIEDFVEFISEEIDNLVENDYKKDLINALDNIRRSKLNSQGVQSIKPKEITRSKAYMRTMLSEHTDICHQINCRKAYYKYLVLGARQTPNLDDKVYKMAEQAYGIEQYRKEQAESSRCSCYDEDDEWERNHPHWDNVDWDENPKTMGRISGAKGSHWW